MGLIYVSEIMPSNGVGMEYFFKDRPGLGREGGEPENVWFSFIFSLTSSALDHSLLRPLVLDLNSLSVDKFLRFQPYTCC